MNPDYSIIFSVFDKTCATPEFSRGDSVRLFHGRGKHYSGLNGCVIDSFSPVVLVTLFQEASEEWLAGLTHRIVEYFSEKQYLLECVVVQKRYLPKAPFEICHGNLPEKVFARRKGLRFGLSFSQQNVGFFLDIEPARIWLEDNAANKRVLNLFSYTCAFSVVAKKAGAEQVVNIDMSRRSLNTGRDNHMVNELGTEGVHFLPHDIFKSWGKLKKYGPYDIVIIDPPSFQKGSFIAEKDYIKVLRRMESLVSENGCVLACLNSPEVHIDQFRESCSQGLENFSWQSDLAANPFFPESEEGHGLKMLVYKRIAKRN